jgi:hypothetical protein
MLESCRLSWEQTFKRVAKVLVEGVCVWEHTNDFKQQLKRLGIHVADEVRLTLNVSCPMCG